MIVSAIFLIDFKHVIIVSLFVLIQTSNELLMLYWGICELPATVWAVPPSELSAGLRDVWVSLWCCAGRHTGTQHNTVMSSPCFLFIFRNCYNYLLLLWLLSSLLLLLSLLFTVSVCVCQPHLVLAQCSVLGGAVSWRTVRVVLLMMILKCFKVTKIILKPFRSSDWFNVNNSSTEAHSKYCTNKIPAEYRFIWMNWAHYRGSDVSNILTIFSSQAWWRRGWSHWPPGWDLQYGTGLDWSGEEDNLVTWSLLTNVLAQWSVLLLGSNCSPIEWAGLVVTTILKKNYSMLLLLSGKNYNNIHYVNSNPVFIMEYYKFDIQQL